MITVCTFTTPHTSAVIDLILPIQQQEYHLPVTLEAQADLFSIADFYQQKNGNFWLALDGDEVVGTIALVDIDHHQVALRKMFVKASHRGGEHGVARVLMETLVAWCKARDVREIYLGTSEKFLAAHRFYEKHDFIQVDKNGLPANFFAMAIDSLFYRRSV
jgi:N-acetylglutamate synthase-like GNAT family acetyltransferase